MTFDAPSHSTLLGDPVRPAWAMAGTALASPLSRWGGLIVGAAAAYLAAQGISMSSSWIVALPAMAACGSIAKRAVEAAADFSQAKSHGDLNGFSDFCRVAIFSARQMKASGMLLAGTLAWPIRLAFPHNNEAISAATNGIDAMLKAGELIGQEKIYFLGARRCCEEAFGQLDFIDGLNTSITNAAPHLELLKELWTRGRFSAAQPDPRKGRDPRRFGPWARESVIRFAKQATICPLSPEAELSLRSFIHALDASEEAHDIGASIANQSCDAGQPTIRRPRRL